MPTFSASPLLWSYPIKESHFDRRRPSRLHRLLQRTCRARSQQNFRRRLRPRLWTRPLPPLPGRSRPPHFTDQHCHLVQRRPDPVRPARGDNPSTLRAHPGLVRHQPQDAPHRRFPSHQLPSRCVRLARSISAGGAGREDDTALLHSGKRRSGACGQSISESKRAMCDTRLAGSLNLVGPPGFEPGTNGL